MAIEEKDIKVNDLTVHYCQCGASSSRPVMLLHGGIGNARLNWSESMPLLAEEFYVLAPDLPGVGGSDALPNLNIPRLLEWIQQLMSAFQMEQMALVGSDLGALLVRLFSAANPQSVPAAVLVNGGSIPSIPGGLRMLARIPLFGGLIFQFGARSTLSTQGLERLVHSHALLTPEFVEQAHSSLPLLSRVMHSIASQPLPEQQVPLLPVLLLWGADDSVATLSDAKRIQKSIPGAQLSEIRDCGHLPQIEAVEVFAWQTTKFLNDPSPSRPDLPGVGRLN
ncbi:MAG: alpha/beta hydrolase [Anaerolineae bacterium]|nr:alpha/beta hydrolase [Anaerolineae bacterium]